MNRYVGNGIKSFNKSMDFTKEIINNTFPTWAMGTRTISDSFRYIDTILGDIHDSDSSYRSAEFTLQTGNIFQHDKLYLSDDIDTDTFTELTDEDEFINQFPATWEKDSSCLVTHDIGYIDYLIREYHYDIGITYGEQVFYNRFNFYDEYIRDFYRPGTKSTIQYTEHNLVAGLPSFLSSNRDIDVVDTSGTKLLWCSNELYIQDIDMDKDGFISDNDVELYIEQIRESGILIDALDVDNGKITDSVLELIRYRAYSTIHEGWYILSDTDQESVTITYKKTDIILDSGDELIVDYEPVKILKFEDTNDVVYIDAYGNLYFNRVNINYLRNEKNVINIVDFDIYGAYIYFLIEGDEYTTLNSYDMLTYEFAELYTFTDNSPRRLCCKPDDSLLIWEYDGIYNYRPIYNNYIILDDGEYATLRNHDLVTSKIRLMSVFDYIGEWFQCYRYVNETLYQYKNRLTTILDMDTDNYVDFCNVFLGFGRSDTDTIVQSIPLSSEVNIETVSDLYIELDTVAYPISYNATDSTVYYNDITLGVINNNFLYVTPGIDEFINADGDKFIEITFRSRSLELVYSFFYQYRLNLYRPITEYKLENIDTEIVKNSSNITDEINNKINTNKNMYDTMVSGQTVYNDLQLSRLMQDNSIPIARYDDTEVDTLPSGTYGLYDEISFDNHSVVQEYGTRIEEIEFYGANDRDEVKYLAQLLSPGGSELILTYTCDPGIYVDDGIKRLYSSIYRGFGTQRYVSMDQYATSSDKHNNSFLDLTMIVKDNTYDTNTTIYGDTSQELKLSIEKSHLFAGQWYVNITPRKTYPGTVILDSDSGKLTVVGINNTANPYPESFILKHIGKTTIDISDYGSRYGIFRDSYFDNVTYTLISEYNGVTNSVKCIDAFNSNITEIQYAYDDTIIYEYSNDQGKKFDVLPEEYLKPSILQSIMLGLTQIVIDDMIVDIDDIVISNYTAKNDYLVRISNISILDYQYSSGDGVIFSKTEAMQYFKTIIPNSRILDVFTFTSKVFSDTNISEELDPRFIHTNRNLYMNYGISKDNNFLTTNDLTVRTSTAYVMLSGTFYNLDVYTNYVLNISEDLL